MTDSESFFDRLVQRVREVDSLLCVGLDPHPQLLAEPSAAAARQFCQRLIDQTAEYVCAFKPNSAFFELYGGPGWAALGELIAAVPKGIPVILDAKRGDIASTARAYVRAIFETLGADAVTLSPYLGADAIEPFLEDPRHGAFLLCKTSNPGADDLQQHPGKADPLYMRVARLAAEWNRRGNLGLVVGATDPEALANARRVAPDLWILAPGVGAQGGELEQAIGAGIRADGLGLVIPVSRAISAAKSPASKAMRLRDTVRQQARKAISQRDQPHNVEKLVQSDRGRKREVVAEPDSDDLPGLSPAEDVDRLAPHLERLADELLASGCVKFGEFTLKSGDRSPIYLDLRLLAGQPRLLALVAQAYLPLLEPLAFDRLCGVPYAGIPIATAVALNSGHPLLYTRKERKTYGTRAAVEGGSSSGERVVLIDDLATTGGSKFEAIDQLSGEGLQVEDVVVLIDRQGGAREALEARGLRLHAVFRLTALLDHWEARQLISSTDLESARAFLHRSGLPPSTVDIVN